MAWVGKEFTLRALGSTAAERSFNNAIGLDPNCGLAWLGVTVSAGDLYGGGYQIFDKAVKLNPKYATDLFSDRSMSLNFKREVFLKEGFPRTSEATKSNVAPVPPPVPQKTAVERFAELNKIKKNATKQN